MLWNVPAREDLEARGELARQVHSAWLTRALRTRGVPRIPTRAVAEGGFEAITRTQRGRTVRDRWWRRVCAALDRLW